MNRDINTPDIERHPLRPFLPQRARLLMLGSFPPPRARWCMEFFYPNPQNDMWRIMGQVFYSDKNRFVEQKAKPTFRYEEIVAFCKEKGIAIFDTAQAVRRLQGNAADEHLEIVEKTDIAALLGQLPQCRDICCTGQKAAETLAETLGCKPPKVGEYIETEILIKDTSIATSTQQANQATVVRPVCFWRMPSSSRAYPLSLDRKAEAYKRMMAEVGLIL